MAALEVSLFPLKMKYLKFFLIVLLVLGVYVVGWLVCFEHYYLAGLRELQVVWNVAFNSNNSGNGLTFQIQVILFAPGRFRGLKGLKVKLLSECGRPVLGLVLMAVSCQTGLPQIITLNSSD